jgi:hypothetical protein
MSSSWTLAVPGFSPTSQSTASRARRGDAASHRQRRGAPDRAAGAAEASVGDETGRLEGHQVALVPAMVPHDLRNVGDENSSPGKLLELDDRRDLRTAAKPESLQVFAFGAPIPIAAPLEETVPA